MPLTLNDFEDVFLLKEGGQNSLSLAFDQSLSRWSLLRSSKYSSADLEDEAKIYAKLEHPGLVPLWGLGLTDDQTWMIQPYLHGLDGTQLTKVPMSTLIEFSRQWLHTLAYLHSKGILHKDLHPGNLLVSGSKAFLLDLGMSVNQGANGSLHYLAPESLHGEYTVQSEVFCFALCFMRLFSGQDLIQTESLSDLSVIGQISFDLESLPIEIRPILSSCLDVNPENRPESIDELLETFCALEALVDHSYIQGVMIQADQILAQALVQAPIGLGSKRRHLLTWLEHFPNSEKAQDLLISWARLKDTLMDIPEQTPEVKLPIKKWLLWKLCFLLIVTILVWLILPTSKQMVDLNQLAQDNILSKTTFNHERESENFIWIQIPDSIKCTELYFEGRKLKENKVLTSKSKDHQLICFHNGEKQVWNFSWNRHGAVIFSK